MCAIWEWRWWEGPENDLSFVIAFGAKSEIPFTNIECGFVSIGKLVDDPIPMTNGK